MIKEEEVLIILEIIQSAPFALPRFVQSLANLNVEVIIPTYYYFSLEHNAHKRYINIYY